MNLNILNWTILPCKFKYNKEIKKGKAIYCETVLVSKLNLKKEVAWPGNQVCFSWRQKMKASHRWPGAAKAQPGRFQIIILFSKELFADLFRFKSEVNYHPKLCAFERTPSPCRFASLFHFSAKQCVSNAHLHIRENPAKGFSKSMELMYNCLCYSVHCLMMLCRVKIWSMHPLQVIWWRHSERLEGKFYWRIPQGSPRAVLSLHLRSVPEWMLMLLRIILSFLCHDWNLELCCKYQKCWFGQLRSLFQFDSESVLHLDESDLSTWIAQHAALAASYHCIKLENHLVFYFNILL